MRSSLVLKVCAFALTLTVLISGSRGYPFGMSRLWSLQRGGAYSEPFTMERPIMLSSRQAPNPAAGFVNDYVTVLESNPAGRDYRDSSYPFIKKSQYIPGSKPLRRFNGSSSRNCFFTPIQCMIQHDMSKYKKLVDSSARVFNGE